MLKNYSAERETERGTTYIPREICSALEIMFLLPSCVDLTTLATITAHDAGIRSWRTAAGCSRCTPPRRAGTTSWRTLRTPPRTSSTTTCSTASSAATRRAFAVVVVVVAAAAAAAAVVAVVVVVVVFVGHYITRTQRCRTEK